MFELVPPSEANLRDRTLPRGFYQVLRQPAPLAGCEFPFGFQNWEELYGRGFRHVVCLASSNPTYSCGPLSRLASIDLTDLSEREMPYRPKEEAARIEVLARSVVASLHAGEGVLVHCAAGRGRAGSVIGCALRVLGMEAVEVVSYLNELHWLRNGASWPESPWQSELVAALQPEH